MMRLWRCLTALVLALLLTLSVGAAGTAGFSDVPESHWAAQSIRRCAQYNLLQGVGGGRFGLGRTMTRAAYATALCRLMGWELVTPEKGSFTDNQDTAKWYYSAIETAYAHGALTGESRQCRPNDAITREEMAKMTVRALGLAMLSGAAADDCPFSDVSVAQGYVALAYRMGIIKGVSAYNFEPKKEATREQAAAMLVQGAAHPEANIIFGASFDDSLDDEIVVTVIATGFDEKKPETVKIEEPRDANLFTDARERAETQKEPAAVPAPEEDGEDPFDTIFKIFNK